MPLEKKVCLLVTPLLFTTFGSQLVCQLQMMKATLKGTVIIIITCPGRVVQMTIFLSVCLLFLPSVCVFMFYVKCIMYCTFDNFFYFSYGKCYVVFKEMHKHIIYLVLLSLPLSSLSYMPTPQHFIILVFLTTLQVFQVQMTDVYLRKHLEM